MTKRRLYILHKLPTPYNDDLFRALHEAEEIDLQVVHLWRGSERRPWKQPMAQGYPNFYMDPKLGLDVRSLRSAWSDRDSVFIVGDWAHVPTLALIFARLFRRAPVALWVDTPQEHLPRPFYKRVPRAYFLRWLLRRVPRILGSGKPARRVLQQMGAPAESIVDFQFMVDLARPARVRDDTRVRNRAQALRDRVGCGQNGVVLAMCGTIDLKKKAQDLGLRAFARAAREAARPLGLLVAGGGDQLPGLQRLANELGVADSVAFLGWQEPEEMDAVYVAADALLHPANYDPFPLVVIEAMSFGRAVLGSDACGSVEERVVDGVNGYAFPAGDVDAMADRILRLADREHLRRLQAAARSTAESWPISRGVEIIEQTIDELMSARR